MTSAAGSYLVGDVDAGEAVVVDPAFAIEPYLDAARSAGVRIVRVLETHARRQPCWVTAASRSSTACPSRSTRSRGRSTRSTRSPTGRRCASARSRSSSGHTPGHRPEHCSFVVGGELVLTGDSMFVGAAARPDLAIEAREGAGELWALAAPAGRTARRDGRVSGPRLGLALRHEHERRALDDDRPREGVEPGLRDDEGTFVEESASLTTPRPPTTERCVALNRGPWVAARPPLELLDGPGDATVLDVRPVEDFVAGHIDGAISVALDGGSFATRFGVRARRGASPLRPARALRGRSSRGSTTVHAVGLFEQLGFVVEAARDRDDADGDGAQSSRGCSTPTPDIAGARRPRAERARRRRRSRARSQLPYRDVRIAPPDELDPARPVYTICASGPRATLAASLLARAGFDARPTLGGGVRDVVQERERLVESV